MIEAIMPVVSPMGIVGPGLINSGNVSCDFRSSLGSNVFVQISSQEGKQAATAAMATDIASLKSELDLEIAPVNWLIGEATYMDKSTRQIVRSKTLIAEDFGGRTIQEVTDAGEHETGTLPEWQRIDKLAKKIVDAPDGTIMFWVSPGEERSNTIVPHRATAWIKTGTAVKGYFYELPGDRKTLERMMKKLGWEEKEQVLEEQVIRHFSAPGNNFHHEVIQALSDSLDPSQRAQLEPTVLKKLREEAELSENAREERFKTYKAQYLHEFEKAKEADIEHMLGIIAQGLTVLPQIIDSLQASEVEKQGKVDRLALDSRGGLQDSREISIHAANSREATTEKIQSNEFTVPLALTAYTLVFIIEAAQKKQVFQEESRVDSKRNVGRESGMIAILDDEITKDYAPKAVLADSSAKKDLELPDNLSELPERLITESYNLLDPSSLLERESDGHKISYQATDISSLNSTAAFDKAEMTEEVLLHILETVVGKLETVSIPEEESEAMVIGEELVNLGKDILMIVYDKRDTGTFTPSQLDQINGLSFFLSLYSDEKTSREIKVLLVALIYHQMKKIRGDQQILDQSPLFSVSIEEFDGWVKEAFAFEKILAVLINTLSQLLNMEREKISEDVLFFLYYFFFHYRAKLHRTESIYSFERLPNKQQSKRKGIASQSQQTKYSKHKKDFSNFGIIYHAYYPKSSLVIRHSSFEFLYNIWHNRT